MSWPKLTKHPKISLQVPCSLRMKVLEHIACQALLFLGNFHEYSFVSSNQIFTSQPSSFASSFPSSSTSSVATSFLFSSSSSSVFIYTPILTPPLSCFFFCIIFTTLVFLLNVLLKTNVFVALIYIFSFKWNDQTIFFIRSTQINLSIRKIGCTTWIKH